MNRKKTIDYTVTRRPRERDSFGVNSSKSRPDSTSRDQRGRGDGDGRNKTPFWSKDDNNLGSELNFNPLQMLDNMKETIPGGHYDRMQDAALSNLRGEMSRTALSQDVKDDSLLFGRVNDSSYTRDGIRGPIIDEFSEDAYSFHSNPKSKRVDSRDSKDRQRRRTDSSSARKRSYSPTDNKSSSYRISRGDTPTKHSRSTDFKSGSQRKNDDDDLRNVIKQFQKSKWDDVDVGVSDKNYDTKQDRKRRKEGSGVLSSDDMFTMSSKGTLVSLPLEPLSDNRDYFDAGFSGDYRDDDHQKGKKGSYGVSAKERDSREARQYSRTRYMYQSSKQSRRGSYDDGQRGLSNDMDSRDSRYDRNKHGSLNDGNVEPLLDPYGETSNLEISRLSSDALRDLPLSELAQKSSQKYKTGFELGRPFFGLRSESQDKEEGWQDPNFDGVSKGADMWKTLSDSLPDRRVETYSDTMDDNSQDLKQMQKERFGKYTPSRTLFKSKAGERDMTGNSFDYKDNTNNSSGQKGNLKTVSQPFKSSTTTPHSKNNSKDSTSTMQKAGPKPLFPSGFLPRQLQKPVDKKVQKVVDKGLNEPPLLSRKSGYYPRNTEISRSRSRSSERGDDKKDLGSSNSSTKREVRPPSNGKFTTQNWSGLESNGNRKHSIERDSSKGTQQQTVAQGDMPTKSNRGRGGIKPFGRGNFNMNHNRGRGTAFNPRGRGRGARGGRGRGARGRGIGVGIRGRGIMTFRGRGFSPRGRGRGVSHPPVGATVKNIFRRSRSLSPVGSKNRKSSRSPNSPQRQRSRSEKQKERRSRSRSSSFCSTCSSHSCSTCYSWQDISLDSLSGKGDRDRKMHHKTWTSSKEEKEKNKVKSVEKLKSDIQTMEKQLEQKSVRAVVEKKKESKGKFDLKTAKGEPKVDIIKEEKKDVKTKERQSSGKNMLTVKEEKGSKEQKGKDSKDVQRELKKKTENTREVILKSDKRRESSKVIKKEKESPVREVKIVNEKKNKGDKVLDEKSGSKMKVDTLKITIDQAEKRPDTKKDKRSYKGKEKSADVGKRSSKSPPGKQKKKEKEKVKAKKAKKKAKKKKHDRDSEDSGDESVYSSISGQDESSTYRPLEARYDERIVEFSSSQGFDSNRIAVLSAKRETAGGHVTSRKLSEGEASKTHPSRKNLIAIPMSKEPDIPQKSTIPPNGRVPWPKEQQHGYPLSKGGQDGSSSNDPYSKVSLPNEGEFEKVDWEKAKFDGGYHTESALGDLDYTSPFQEIENQSQEWRSEQEGGDDPDNYYYEEGTEGEGYEQEYHSYGQEGEWQAGDQGGYQEWYEGEYPQEGAEGEADAGYEGEYYLGEDGLYYPVEGQAYQEYQGEYIEGGTEGQVLDPEQDVTYAEGDYQYQYSEEGGEWQQYEDAAVYQTEEGWNQGEADGQWQEEYQEGYYGAESEWGTEYTQGGEYDVGAQGYAVEGTETLPEEGYSAAEGYDQQLVPEQYYMESVPVQEEGHHVEHSLEPQQQEEPVTSVYYDEEPLVSKDDYKDMAAAPTEKNIQESKPLKSILKKSKQVEGNGKGTKLVSERLSQMKKQSMHTIEIPQQSSASAPSVQSVQSVEKQEVDPDQTTAASAQSEAERYREMEEAILSSQPKDAIGTEYVVRVHGSGTANFYCKLCQCRFNTLTAKNLHIKGMKHIELYIRLKSSLLQSVIKDTKVETPKRPAEDDPSAAQKFPRRF